MGVTINEDETAHARKSQPHEAHRRSTHLPRKSLFYHSKTFKAPSPTDLEVEELKKKSLDKKRHSEPPDPFQRGDQVAHLARFEDQLLTTQGLFIHSNIEDGKKQMVNPDLSEDGCRVIRNYDMFNAKGDRPYIVTQCNKTKSGMKKGGRDPLLYVVTNETGDELIIVKGRFSIIHCCCGRGVKIFLGGKVIGYISKHLFGVYALKDRSGRPHYLIVPCGSNQLAVEYMFDDVVAAFIAKGVWKDMGVSTHQLLKTKVYGLHFEKEAQASPELKALMFGAMIAILHDRFRHDESTDEPQETPPAQNPVVAVSNSAAAPATTPSVQQVSVPAPVPAEKISDPKGPAPEPGLKPSQ